MCAKENIRLFDFLEEYCNLYPTKGFLHAKINQQWKGYTAPEIKKISIQLANSLQKLGISKQDNSSIGKDKIAIISNNRPEWLIADYAIQQMGCVCVPLFYPSINATELEYILNNSKVKVLFFSDKIIYNKIKAIQEKLPTLKYLFSFDRVDGVEHWETLLQEVSAEDVAFFENQKESISADELATIIYTSGTTGFPKGVMLSHKNIVSNVLNSMPCFSMCDESAKVLSFLPLNHIFERMVINIYINKGVQIYFAEGMETIGDNLREVQPEVFTTVPRLLEKVFERIEKKGDELQGFSKKVFNWGMNLALNFDLEKSTFWNNIQFKIADTLLFSKWRNAIGGNVKAIVVGSAACQLKLLKIFTAAKLIVMEGYGLTETSPVISVNRYEKEGRKFGTVGKPIDNINVKLADDGEIITQSDSVMMGYYNLPDATNDVIKNGWFYTGDIGEFDTAGFLKITDRKKELFKLSAGKYIAPQIIENKMKESRFIEQIMLVGNNEKFVGALIVPSFVAIKEHFFKIGRVMQNNIDLIKDAEVLKLIRKELDKGNQTFTVYEHVKKFQLLLNEWTVDNEEITPTLKLKRKNIAHKYAHLIEKIYA